MTTATGGSDARNGLPKRPAERQDVDSDEDEKIGNDDTIPKDIQNGKQDRLHIEENPTITITAICWLVALQAIHELLSHEVILPAVPSLLAIFQTHSIDPNITDSLCVTRRELVPLNSSVSRTRFFSWTESKQDRRPSHLTVHQVSIFTHFITILQAEHSTEIYKIIYNDRSWLLDLIAFTQPLTNEIRTDIKNAYDLHQTDELNRLTQVVLKTQQSTWHPHTTWTTNESPTSHLKSLLLIDSPQLPDPLINSTDNQDHDSSDDDYTQERDGLLTARLDDLQEQCKADAKLNTERSILDKEERFADKLGDYKKDVRLLARSQRELLLHTSQNQTSDMHNRFIESLQATADDLTASIQNQKNYYITHAQEFES